MEVDREKALEKALLLCIDALYEAILIAPIDRIPEKAGEAIQEAQYILEN